MILSVWKQEIIYLTLKTFGQAFNMNTELRWDPNAGAFTKNSWLLQKI